MRTITKPVPLSVIVGWSVLRRGRPKPKPYSHATVLRTSVIDVAQLGRIFEGSKQKQQKRFFTSNMWGYLAELDSSVFDSPPERGFCRKRKLLRSSLSSRKVITVNFPFTPLHVLISVKIRSRAVSLSSASFLPPSISTNNSTSLRTCLLLVKVAAVIGETFSIDVLGAIFPVELDEAALKAHLNTLVFKNFLTEESSTGRSQCFKFTHSMVRVWQKF